MPHRLLQPVCVEGLHRLPVGLCEQQAEERGLLGMLGRQICAGHRPVELHSMSSWPASQLVWRSRECVCEMPRGTVQHASSEAVHELCTQPSHRPRDQQLQRLERIKHEHEHESEHESAANTEGGAP